MNNTQLKIGTRGTLVSPGAEVFSNPEELEVIVKEGTIGARGDYLYCALTGEARRGESSPSIPFYVQLRTRRKDEPYQLACIRLFIGNSIVDLGEDILGNQRLLELFTQEARRLETKKTGEFNVAVSLQKIKRLGEEVATDGLDQIEFAANQANESVRMSVAQEAVDLGRVEQRVEVARNELKHGKSKFFEQQEATRQQVKELGEAELQKAARNLNLQSAVSEAVVGVEAATPLIQESERLVSQIREEFNKLVEAEGEGVRLDITEKLLRERLDLLPREIKETEELITPILDWNNTLIDSITRLAGQQENQGLLQRLKTLIRSILRRESAEPEIGEMADIRGKIAKLSFAERNALDNSPEGVNDFASAIHGFQGMMVNLLNSPMGRVALTITVLGISATAGYGIKMVMGE